MVTAATVPPKPTQATTALAKMTQSRLPPPAASRGRQEGVVEDVTEEEDLRNILKKVLVAQKRDQEARQADSQEIWRAIRNQEARQADSQEVWKAIVELREFVMQRQGQLPSQEELRGAGGDRAGGAMVDDEGAGVVVAEEAAVSAGSSLAGGGGAAPAGVTRPRFGSSGPNIEAGMLPTPTTQELADRNGKAKMPGYNTDGPLTTDGLETVGRFARDGNGLGWLGLDDEAEDDGLSLVDRRADPVVDQRSGGSGRTVDLTGRMGSAPMEPTETGGTEPSQPEGGRTEAGQIEGGRTKPGRAGVGRTGHGWTNLGRPKVGQTGHRPNPTHQPPGRAYSKRSAC
ncbi:unnamed protein product [Linum trigynum]|uniref:Uncharacterized protein n=1 Tax=Linum trigynum TaxID=586398 RepID=A0AAV2FZG4_9ROSI